VRNDVTGAALLEMFYELDRMATTSPTDRELADAKRYRAGLYLLNNQVEGAVVGSLVNNWIKGLPPEELGLFVTKISAVTADCERRGKKYFTSRQSVIKRRSPRQGRPPLPDADVMNWGTMTRPVPPDLSARKSESVIRVIS
jgi:predicted Zn-dependent peptidase